MGSSNSAGDKIFVTDFVLVIVRNEKENLKN